MGGQRSPRHKEKTCRWCGAKFRQKIREQFCSLNCATYSRVHVVGPEDCWPWTGYKVGGYGKFAFVGRQWYATHAALELSGAKKESPYVLHTCDNPSCCNPAHLRYGTQADNMRDRLVRGRSNLPVGERHWKSKITPEAAMRIKGLLVAGELPVDVAKECGVSKHIVMGIKRNKAWRSVLCG